MPFLWELRAILDWTVAHTSLELFSFLKLEDIHAGLCVVRADMLYRKAYPRGVAVPKLDKSYMGMLAVLALLLVVTGPLLIFSSASPISEPNPVVAASASLSFIATPRQADVGGGRVALSTRRDRSRSEFPLATFSRFSLITLDVGDPLLVQDFHLHRCRSALTEHDVYANCGCEQFLSMNSVSGALIANTLTPAPRARPQDNEPSPLRSPDSLLDRSLSCRRLERQLSAPSFCTRRRPALASHP